MESLSFFVFCFTLLFLGVASQTTTDEVSEETSEATTPQPPTSTAPDFNCTADGVYAHPNCEYYYSCTDGVDSLLKCMGQFLFDIKYYGCNYPEYTDCGDRIRPPDYPGMITTPDGSTTTPNSGFQCPDLEDKYYPDPFDCTSFYQCVQGNAFHITCSFPLRYNIQLTVCDFPANVDCGDRPLP